MEDGVAVRPFQGIDVVGVHRAVDRAGDHGSHEQGASFDLVPAIPGVFAPVMWVTLFARAVDLQPVEGNVAGDDDLRGDLGHVIERSVREDYR